MTGEAGHRVTGRITYGKTSAFHHGFGDKERQRLTPRYVATHPLVLCSCLLLALILLIAWPCGYYERWQMLPKAFGDMAKGLGDPLVRSLPKGYVGGYEGSSGPRRFFQSLFVLDSPKLRECLSTMLASPGSRPDCLFVDALLVPPLVGIALMPIVIVIAFTVLTMRRRGKCLGKEHRMLQEEGGDAGEGGGGEEGGRESYENGAAGGGWLGWAAAASYKWLYKTDEGFFMWTFGPRRPTRVYPLWLQQVTLLGVLSVCLVMTTMAVVGIGSMVHFDEAMRRSLRGLDKIESNPRDHHLGVRSLVDERAVVEVQAIKNIQKLGVEQVPLLTAATTRAKAAVEGVIASIKELQMAIEGCTSVTTAAQCVADEALWSRVNPCAPPTPQGPASSYTHGVGTGVVVSSGVNTPTCNTTRGLNPDNFTSSAQSIASGVYPKFWLVSNATRGLAISSRHMRDSLESSVEARLSATVILFVSLSGGTILLLLTSLTGSPRLAAVASFLLWFGLVLVWPWWGIIGSFTLPLSELCTNLLPATRTLPDNLIKTLNDQTPVLHDMYTMCVFKEGGQAWERAGVAKKTLEDGLRTWEPEKQIPPSLITSILNVQAILSTAEKALTDVTTITADDPSYGYNALATSTANTAYLVLLRAKLDKAKADAQQAFVRLGEMSGAYSVYQTQLNDAIATEIQARGNVSGAMWEAGLCDGLWSAYQEMREPMCMAALPSLTSLWACVFVAAFTAMVATFAAGFANRQAMQRQRDSADASHSVYAMLGYARFKLTKDYREREAASVRKGKLMAVGLGPSEMEHNGSKGLGEKGGGKEGGGGKERGGGAGAAVGKDDWGVDGWGNQANGGDALERERDPPLFPHRSEVYSAILDHKLYRESDATGRPRCYPDIDTSDLVATDEHLHQKPVYPGYMPPPKPPKLTLREVSKCLWEALAMTEKDAQEVLEARAITLFSAIVQQESEVEREALERKEKREAVLRERMERKRKKNWMKKGDSKSIKPNIELPQYVTRHQHRTDEQVDQILHFQKPGAYTLYRSLHEGPAGPYLGLEPLCVSYKDALGEQQHNIVYFIVKGYGLWKEYQGWVVMGVDFVYDSKPDKCIKGGYLFPSIEAMAEGVPQLQTRVDKIDPNVPLGHKFTPIVRGYLTVKGLSTFLYEGGIEAPESEVSSIMSAINRRVKGDATNDKGEDTELRFDAFRDVLFQEYLVMKDEKTAGDATGWKTVSRGVVMYETEDRGKMPDYGLLSQRVGPGIPPTVRMIQEITPPPSPPPLPENDPEFDFFKAKFEEVDQDGNGALDEDEVALLGQKLGVSWTRKAAKDIVMAIDADGNGSVDLHELWAWVERFQGRGGLDYGHIAVPVPEWGTMASVGATVPATYDALVLARAMRRADHAGIELQQMYKEKSHRR